MLIKSLRFLFYSVGLAALFAGMVTIQLMPCSVGIQIFLSDRKISIVAKETNVYVVKRNPDEAFYYTSYISKDTEVSETAITSRDQDANLLKRALVEQYFIPMGKRLLNEDSTIKFVSYECSGNKVCGGIGDRVRGVVTAFYVALATNRTMHIEWMKQGSNLDDYFDINNAFYNVPEEIYAKRLNASRATPGKIVTNPYFNRVLESALVEWSLQENLASFNEQYDHVAMRTNSMAALEGVLKNKAAAPIFDNLLSGVLSDNKTLDMSIFVTALLRVVFGKPAEKLEQLFQECVVDAVKSKMLWSKSFRIGIQIRQLRPSWREPGRRVTPEKLHCFVERVKEMVDVNIRSRTRKKFLVYITADTDEAVETIANNLNNYRNRVVVYSSKRGCPNKLNTSHIDRPMTTDQLSWLDMAKTYVDWLALTRMDHLLISRSGFAETASFFSMKPTQRLNHTLSANDTRCFFHNFNAIGPNIQMEL